MAGCTMRAQHENTISELAFCCLAWRAQFGHFCALPPGQEQDIGLPPCQCRQVQLFSLPFSKRLFDAVLAYLLASDFFGAQLPAAIAVSIAGVTTWQLARAQGCYSEGRSLWNGRGRKYFGKPAPE